MLPVVSTTIQGEYKINIDNNIKLIKISLQIIHPEMEIENVNLIQRVYYIACNGGFRERASIACLLVEIESKRNDCSRNPCLDPDSSRFKSPWKFSLSRACTINRGTREHLRTRYYRRPLRWGIKPKREGSLI